MAQGAKDEAQTAFNGWIDRWLAERDFGDWKGEGVAHAAKLPTTQPTAARIVIVDPRRTGTADKADLFLQIRPGTDLALLNGILHLLVENGAVVRVFVAVRDVALLPSGGDVLVNVLSNDTDPAGGILVVQSVSVDAGTECKSEQFTRVGTWSRKRRTARSSR